MEETWVQVKGFEGIYEVSSAGRVRSLDRLVNGKPGASKGLKKGKVLKHKIDKYGYPCVQLISSGKRKHVTVHRLVAEAFIPRDDNAKQVNHKDKVKTNNNTYNLEWVTVQENNEHRAARIWKVETPDGRRLFIFNLKKYCREHGLDQAAMWRVFNGKQTNHKGYRSWGK